MDIPNARPLPLTPARFKSKSSLAVTLEDIEENHPGLTHESLTNTPDDQLLFFWTDLARFTVSEPIPRTSPFDVNPMYKDTYRHHYRTITDKRTGTIVGQTAPCNAQSGDEANESGECEFILLASNTPPEHEPQKLVMQIKRRGDGVACRVNIADVNVDAWEGARAERVLVALG
jgi:hypothetical protein